MNRTGSRKGDVAETLTRTLGQILRYLRFDAAAFYWYAPDFNMLWPLIQHGDFQDRIPAVMPGVQLVGEAFEAAAPMVAGDAEIAATGDMWLRAERARRAVTVPVVTGIEKSGVLVAFSRRTIEVTPEMLRAVTVFAAQMSLAMRRASFYATADLQRYQIEALTRIIGAAAGKEISTEAAMYDVVAQQARLLTGARTVAFARPGEGYVRTAGRTEARRRWRILPPQRKTRRLLRAERTVLRHAIPSRSLTLGLLWRCSFEPSRQQRALVDLIGHALAAIDTLRERLAIAERERQAQYLSDVSKALSISLEPSVVFEQITTLVVPEVADCVVVDIRSDIEEPENRIEAPPTSDIQRLLYDAVRSTKALDEILNGNIARRSFSIPLDGQIAEAIIVPLITGTGVIGAILFGRSLGRGTATREQCEVYEELSAHAASALVNAESFRKERDIANLLQHALQATALPIDQRALFDAAYVPGARSQVGGDWYDVFALDNDRYAVSVGDVGGHGTIAAITMNVVRLAFRAAALGGDDPVQVLERGDAMLRLENESPMVTALYGVVDLKHNVFSYASAGHYPPFLAQMDGRIETLPTSGHPLGTGFDGERKMLETPLAAGNVLVFYTDGLIEYDRDIFAGEHRLTELLRTLIVEEPRSTLARRLHAVVFSGSVKQHDDTAILTIAIRPNKRMLEWRMPAIPSAAPVLRANLDEFWDETPLGANKRFNFITATGEAIANCLEHAYVDAERGIVVRASYDEETVIVEIADRGRYKTNGSSPDRGRGMTIMRALSDGITVDGSDEGTLVHLSFR